MRRQLWSTVLTFSLVIASSPAFAGERYAFTIELTGGLLDHVQTGRVLAEGDRYRVELLPDRHGKSNLPAELNSNAKSFGAATLTA